MSDYCSIGDCPLPGEQRTLYLDQFGYCNICDEVVPHEDIPDHYIWDCACRQYGRYSCDKKICESKNNVKCTKPGCTDDVFLCAEHLEYYGKICEWCAYDEYELFMFEV